MILTLVTKMCILTHSLILACLCGRCLPNHPSKHLPLLGFSASFCGAYLKPLLNVFSPSSCWSAFPSFAFKPCLQCAFLGSRVFLGGRSMIVSLLWCCSITTPGPLLALLGFLTIFNFVCLSCPFQIFFPFS